jgi:hypothetical protein
MNPPEHFDRALSDGKVSTNAFLRRIHNFALDMNWLLKSVIPRLQWPKPVFKSKRVITAEEHAAIIQREFNAVLVAPSSSAEGRNLATGMERQACGDEPLSGVRGYVATGGRPHDRIHQLQAEGRGDSQVLGQGGRRLPYL